MVMVKKPVVTSRIPQLIAERGWTIAEFARKTGLAYNTAVVLANGNYERIGNQTIAAVCRGLGVQPGDLFVYSDDDEDMS